MNCPLETRENAQLLLDYCIGNLEPESAASLEQHLAICGACREFARGQQAVWHALDGWEGAPVTLDFDRRLYRRIEEQASWWGRLFRPLRPFPHITLRRGLPAAAMACLVLTAGILLERSAVSPPPPGDTAHVDTVQQVDTVQVDTVQPEQVERTLDAMEMLDEFSHHLRTDTPNSRL